MMQLNRSEAATQSCLTTVKVMHQSEREREREREREKERERARESYSAVTQAQLD